jgi:class 3 adenylate cyclase
MSILFAATYPERTDALVLYGTFAKGRPDAEHEGVMGEMDLSRVIDAVMNHWGDGSSMDLFMPSMASRGDREREQRGLYERAAASPSLAASVLQAALDIDVTEILPSVHVPTLVVHRTGDVIPVSGGRFLAERIPGAKLVELPGRDHAPWTSDADSVVGEIEGFLTGTRHAKQVDRTLATVLFTDIVQSTQTAASLGDDRWRQVLEAHDRLIREQLHAYEGREVKHTGDGFLATFDGPARAVRCACAIRDGISQSLGISVRIGVHTGECEAVGDDLAGLTVHIGARIAALAEPNEVLVSSTVRDLVVGSEIKFSDHGIHQLKGAPGEWRLLAVSDSAADSLVGAPTAPPSRSRSERTVLAMARYAPWLLRRAAKRDARRRAATIRA